MGLWAGLCLGGRGSTPPFLKEMPEGAGWERGLRVWLWGTRGRPGPSRRRPAPRGVCTQAPCYCILMEFCAQGQLYEVLRAGRPVTPSLLVDWSMGIAGGMNYLHLHKIIHRDLKSPK